MAPKTPHICDKEWRISTLEEKDRNKSIEYERLMKVLEDFIKRADVIYLEKKIFEIHEITTDKIDWRIIKLEAFRERLLTKIAFVTWITSTIWFLFANFIKDLITK